MFVAAGLMGGVAAYFGFQQWPDRLASPPAPSTLKPPKPPVNLETLKSQAESGDPAAQTTLGWIYEKGTGFKRPPTKIIPMVWPR
jgi:TPR repeat protein